MEIENDRKKDCNVHNLTFLRNNSYPQRINFDKEQNCFFMMDYYNLLKERKLRSQRDGYMVLVGAYKGENNAVAKRIMGVYSEEDFQDEQVFQTAAAEDSTTSKHPFLGIIQVYITDYMWMKNDKPMQADQIDCYLESYKKQIENCLKPVLNENDLIHIYRTITSEDFCIIIRTLKVRKIYQAALQIMSIKNKQQKRVFFTYTNIGIECVKSEGENNLNTSLHFLRLHESVGENNGDVNFVLRFRIENEALEEIQALEFQQKNQDETAGQVVIEAVNGMVGRYDLVVRLNMAEFMEIYPYLCLSIAGYKIVDADLEKIRSPLTKIVVEKMDLGVIQTINTRIIMDIYAKKKSEKADAVSSLDMWDTNGIKKRTEKVMSLYNEFKRMHDTKFFTDKYRYVELTRMLDTLIFSYENLAYEIDTHINWFICSQYLEDFFRSMITYMNPSLQISVSHGIDKFLNEFQKFVSAFDVYLRLLQGLNQNTIQSPRYDISAPIDGQKFIMAYGEFIDSVHEEYRNDEWDKKGDDACCEKRRVENTIIYPDLTIKKPELMEVFNYDKVINKKDTAENPAILLCKIPMFEYFERPYDLIPLILHEIGHHMLILKREIRNQYLIKKVFQYIAVVAVQQVQSRFVKKGYEKRADALTKAIQESLADAMMETFKEKCPDYEQYVFLHLKQRIVSYVCSYFENEDAMQNSRLEKNSLKIINNDFETLISDLYVNDEEMLKEFHDINLKADLPEKERYGNLDKLRKFAEKLLLWVNELTIQYSKPIILKKLLTFTNQELDSYLLWWAKENETDILKMKSGNLEERKQLIKNYLELVKRTYILYVDASFIQKDRVDNFREELAKKIAPKAKRQLEKFLNEGEYYYIYDQAKMKKAAFWELKNTERSKKRFMEAMECIDSVKIMDAIQFRLTNYREVCADIIMSKWLGLSSFGYFRQAVALAPRMQGYAGQMQYGAMHWERMLTVLSVLAAVENEEITKGTKVKETEIIEIDLSSLQADIWKYIDETMKCTKERIWMSMQLNDSLDKEDAQTKLNQLFKRVSEQIQLLEANVLRNKKIVWEENVWDRLFKKDDKFEEMSDYFSYFYKEANIFKRLYDMLDAYSRIQVNNKLHVESEVFNHIVCVYKNAVKGRRLHKVVREVAEFYNNPKSEKKTNAQKMTDMLRFVQDYYYCNRIKKAEESKWELGMQGV